MFRSFLFLLRFVMCKCNKMLDKLSLNLNKVLRLVPKHVRSEADDVLNDSYTLKRL